MAYDFAWLRYRDPNYGKLVNDAPRQVFQSEGCYFPTLVYGKLPERPLAGLKSLIFDNLGYAILRGEDGGGHTFLLMDYGPHGGSHGHPDKLNLILFADGDELAGEPQVFRYEDARHADWTRPTIAHWTVSVDERSQMPTTGKLLAFHDAGAVKLMRGVCHTAYPGVGLDRTVVQMPGYLVDVYHCWSRTQHLYDYPLCFRGSLDVVKSEGLKPMSSSVVRGYKHILVGEPLKTDTAWRGVWKCDVAPASLVEATVLPGEGTTVYAGAVPGDRHQAVIRRQGTATTFLAVIDPYKDADAVKSAGEMRVDGAVPACGLKVSRTDGGTDLILVRYDPRKDNRLSPASAFDGGKTNALVSIVRLDPAGKAVVLGMVGGTTLAYGDKTLSLDTPGIRWLR
jgi:hypothetical protein